MTVRRPAAPDAFIAAEPTEVMDAERFVSRTAVFDQMLAATQAHYWNPMDPRYIDFATPFDLTAEPMLPTRMAPALFTPHGQERLSTDAQRIAFINAVAHWQFSSLLYGEQAALMLSASLCHLFRDLGTQEYAANQAREEARHVTAFARYVRTRWGAPLPCGPALRRLICDIEGARSVHLKIVGMQIIIEGLAMGAFATGFQTNRDPLARRLFQLVMTDEAFHHKFGRMWADRVIPQLGADERDEIEDWAAHCFEHMVMNLTSPVEMRVVFERFGLDPDIVAGQLVTPFIQAELERLANKPTGMLRVVVNTLYKQGIITERTRARYPAYIDLEPEAGAGDTAGADIVSEGLAYLAALNGTKEPQALMAG